MKSPVKRFTTKDGSHSLLHEELNETYHSTHGAIQESNHVFLTHGLHAHHATPLTILEYGMGTGLNVLLTAIAAWQQQREIHITTLEAFPLDKSIWSSINYPSLLTLPEASDWFEAIHTSPWSEKIELNEYLTLTKIQTTFESFLPEMAYDLIYFDAFAPSKQPELWTKQQIAQAVNGLKPNGIFVTYSARGQLKRDLAELGLQVETLDGPPGKKEMVRAIKS